ncbi:LacI family DNA-binding transcriptional regulator [Nonomuraea sp. SYSU D8015]|uniref:LacI family DNA-binding transcriptional regulator n=1 Tax=Nonomuraea sp. SYSU D8015 TaxID=2593644 RepID=UPI001660873F|nr:LacI family DNA-binding transcriptional regulator [Nonomuraea sp. SYSU D8015]
MPRKPSPDVTMADVARVAGVSIATVSNALNSAGRMSQSTRDTVRRVARELGYLPGKTHTRTLGLAVTTDHPASWGFAEIPYFSQAIQTATVVAHEHGYGLVVQPTAVGLERWAVLAVDGMLLIDSPKGDRVRADLLMRGVPVVHIGRPASPQPHDIWVDNDVEGAVRGVLDHLSEAGARRVALLGGDTTDSYIQACMTTYRQWCAERGEPALLELMRRKNPAPAVARLLSRDDPPDAIFGPYDRCGHAVLSAAPGHGLRIPEDLLVACASESSAYETTTPPVTTLSLDPVGATRIATELLIQLVEGETPAVSGGVVHHTRLLVRTSTLRHPSTASLIG